MLLFLSSPLMANPACSPGLAMGHIFSSASLSPPSSDPGKRRPSPPPWTLPGSGKVIERKGLQAAPGFPELQHSQTRSPFSLEGSSQAERQRPYLIPTGRRPQAGVGKLAEGAKKGTGGEQEEEEGRGRHLCSSSPAMRGGIREISQHCHNLQFQDTFHVVSFPRCCNVVLTPQHISSFSSSLSSPPPSSRCCVGMPLQMRHHGPL